MPYVITQPCINEKDESCIEVCPVDCIYDVGTMRVIDPDECIDCGACEPVCPVDAIFQEEDVPAKWERYVEVNAAMVDGADAVTKLLADKPA
jgi:ferredoxin